jgi:predicted RNA binding protein YcfA (HicA-like mRNA interferase family)
LRLPRDLSGHELIRLLRRYDYQVTRQVGSHIFDCSRVFAVTRTTLTVPDHRSLRLGTRSTILSDVAAYLNLERSKLELELFQK